LPGRVIKNDQATFVYLSLRIWIHTYDHIEPVVPPSFGENQKVPLIAEGHTPMIEAVIFDIDGTLVDSVDLHARAWQEALQHFGDDLAFEQVRHEIGKGGDQLLPDLLPPRVVDSQGEEIEKYRSEILLAGYDESPLH
jgi:Haloacid dehalogenase-like hydrolase